MKTAWMICCVLLATQVAAQRNQVWGYLRDSASHEPVALASVTNNTTGTTVMTANTGRFSIAVSQGQILSFAAVGYYFDTVLFNSRYMTGDTITLFLSPLAHSLGNVTVTARGMSRYQLDSIERRNFFLQGRVDYKLPAVARANSGAGIALNLDRFSRHEREKRKAFALFDANEKEAYINYRFPASLVTQYTGFKDDELREFMQLYRPDANWLRKNTDEEDIKYYINDKLKLFKRRK